MNETFYAAIAGALVGLIGVLVTLRYNQHNFETNLREEREKAREEREFRAKHKALLSAVETVTLFLNHYLTLPDKELPKDGTTPNELSEMSVSLNRLHFYCDMATIKQSIAMSQVLSRAYIRALKAKMPAMFIAEEIKVVDVEIVNMEKANDRVQQEIIALLSVDHSNPLLISHRQQLASNFKLISGLYTKRTDLFKARYQATEACRDALIKDLKEVYEAVRNVLLTARRELGFPIDEDDYTTMLTQATDSIVAETKSFLEDIRSEVKRRLQ